MRLFAAVPVTGAARAELVRVLALLRATGWPVRWVSDDNLHLTLKFFGEVPPARLAAIENALRVATADAAALAMELMELGTFPTRGPARVLWAGLDAPPGLELLQDRMERSAEAIGFPIEGRPFRPHITLGRVRGGERLPAGGLDRVVARIEPAPFLAEHVVLYESVLGAGGARHLPRLTLALGQ
jgi:2'-5' RNA ligase